MADTVRVLSTLALKGAVHRLADQYEALMATRIDADFAPKFQQKGVDMRIGLDMATIAANRSVDLIALMTPFA